MAKWLVAAKKADFEGIGRKFHIDPVIARIIRNRDITEEIEYERFLHGSAKDLYSPFLMKDMEKAVTYILHTIEDHKTIRIIGDYDIDGICATYILKKGLQAVGAEADTVIPHRVKDGYGLNDQLIQDASEAGISLILTCDNGIAAGEQVMLAKSLGMTVVVTDHHEVPYQETEAGKKFLLPEAEAVVDPKQEDCTYPFSGICGAAVAYKLVEALLETAGAEKNILRELSEWAAFATIGDVMELKDENRILVKCGLEAMRDSESLALKALMAVNGIEKEQLGVYHIGFVLGPCLNAAGRLDTAEKALELLEATEWEKAVSLAGDLKSMNDSRKDMTEKGVEQACALVDAGGYDRDKVLVLYLPQCHESLAGIIAGKVRERYGKPVFVLTETKDGVKGSGRSVEAFSMYEEMTKCRECFTKYGGHKLAAGLSMEEAKVEEFRKKINQNCTLTEADFEETVHIDVPMPMSYVTEKLIKELEVLEPFGAGNPKPLFAQQSIRFLKGRILGKKQNVGKYTVQDQNGTAFEVIFFGDLNQFHQSLSEWFGKENVVRLYDGEPEKIVLHVAYYPTVNEFRGKKSIQYTMQYYDRG